jgi:hypothetical protein
MSETLISKVALVDAHVREVRSSGDPVEVLVDHHGAVSIRGHFKIVDGHVIALDEEGETIIIATLMRQAGEVLVHFSVGDSEARIAHTLTIAGFATLVGNFNTMLELARLELQPKDDS